MLGFVNTYGRRVFYLAAAFFAIACTRPSFVPGDECELNTQCGAPLVCRLGHCRIECRDDRDCGVGLLCVRDGQGLGVCQIPTETDCALSSECNEPLICLFGQCINECVTDVDCPPGSNCVEDDGVFGCRSQTMNECEHSSQCTGRQICAVDGVCRDPCIEDRDCRDRMMCLGAPGDRYCGFAPSMDGGVDGGPMFDAGMPDAGRDAGPLDGGLVAPPDAVRLRAAAHNTCAALSDTDLRCWGSDENQQLGASASGVGDRTSPWMMGLTAVGAFDIGARHMCAQSSVGLRCWGANEAGQLGNNTTSITPTETSQAVVGEISGTVTDVALAEAHTCAIAGGRLFCWGDGSAGQLGLSGTTQSSTSREVPLLGGVALQVATYFRHTCVLLTDGTVRCFGDNSQGQIGNGSTGGSVDTPTMVMGITDAVQIAVGYTFSCALTERGQVYCWGDDASGQLGNDDVTMTDSPVPVRVLVDPGVLQITTGRNFACARRASDVWCWGDNQFGQVAGSDVTFRIPRPVLSPLGTMAEISAGLEHTCGIDFANRIFCHGANANGKLGDGTTMDRRLPVLVAWP